MKGVQDEKSVTREKSNMKKVQHEMSATTQKGAT